MPTDIAYPFSYTEEGDIENVSGREFYEQHAFLIGVQAVADTSGRPTTANETTEIIAQLERAYESSEYFPDTVQVSLVNQTNEQLSISVAIGGGAAFETTLPLSS